MDYEEKSQLPAIGQNTGKVTGKMSANNGIERVRKARERYDRQQRGSGAEGKRYMITCAALCAAIAMVLTVEKAGLVAAAPDTVTLIEAFPQEAQGGPDMAPEGAAEDAPGSGPPQASDAPQLSGPPQASLPVQAYGVGQAPGTGHSPGSSSAGQLSDSTGAGRSSGSTGAGQLSGGAGAGQSPGSTGAPVQEQPTGAELHADSAYILLGTFEITGYCSCDKCCGVKDVKLTKSETVPRSSYTVAVDPEVIPLGTRIMIDGVIYCAEDVGKAIRGQIVDIYFDSHEEALEFGRQKKKVYRVE